MMTKNSVMRSSAALSFAALAAVALVFQATAHGQAAASAQVGGTLQAWGNGLSGQLGNGASTNSDKPVAVTLPAGVTITAVSAGGKHTLALTSAGQVLAWGNNFHGELGDGTTTNSPTPVLVKLPKGTVATAVAAGDDVSMAVTSAGKVFAWGANQYGQLGDGGTQQTSLPTAVVLPQGTRVVAVGTSYNYSLALTAFGHILTWGYNGSGQLGTGFATASEIPVRVNLPRGITVTAVVNGGYHALALTSTGQIMAWGNGGFGELGNGHHVSRLSPVQVKLPAGVKVVAIAAGSQHSLALTSTGEVLAWGRGSFGQLGNASTGNRDLPVRVHIPASDHVTAVSAGGGFSLALTSTGQVLAWGHNKFGQLGDGAMVNADVPMGVLLPAGLIAVALAAGPTTRHSLAIVTQAAS
jgi:alpha-tubulin suppressor-like RCC1 family protein